MDYKFLVRRYTEEVWNNGNLDLIMEYVAPEYKIHYPGDRYPLGPEGEMKLVSEIRNAFPDFLVLIDEILQEGEIVAVRWHAQGTHLGMLRCIPGTGFRLSWTGMNFLKLEHGKMLESLWNADHLGQLQQMHLVASEELAHI